MASETVDLIDSPLPPSFTGQYPVSSTCMVQTGAKKPQDLLLPVGREHATIGMPANE